MAETPKNFNLAQAAFRAGLNPSQTRQIDGLASALSTHQRLSDLPKQYAYDEFNKLPNNKKQSLVALTGTNKPDDDEPNRSWLETGAHYAFTPFKVAAKTLFDALDYASDTMTRVYRTGAIAANENINFGDAWGKAGRDGENIFIQDRINTAVSRYGSARVNVAKRIAAGVAPEIIFAEAQNEEEKRIAAEAQQSETGDIMDPLLRDAVAEVNAAKYSPGRQLANLFLPRDLEGDGMLYSWISGATDATYRLFMDPTLALGKARKIYLGGSQALKVTGKYAATAKLGSAEKVSKYFDTTDIFGTKNVQNLWTDYTERFTKYAAAKNSGNVDEIAQARQSLNDLAPELSDDFIVSFKSFGDKEFGGIWDLDTAKAFLSDASKIEPMLYGQAGARIKLAPRMSPARKARVLALTTGRRVFDIDKDSRALIRTMELTDESALLQAVVGSEVLSPVEASASFAGKIIEGRQNIKRFTPEYFADRLDRIKAKFTPIASLIDDEAFDHASKTAPQDFFRYSRMALGSYHAKAFTEIYSSADLGQRKAMMKGIQLTVGNLIGLDKTVGGRKLLKAMSDDAYAGVAYSARSADGAVPSVVNGIDSALYPSQTSNLSRVIGLRDMQRFAGRESWLGRKLGFQYTAAADGVIDAWTFGTIAGPRFPLRNAIEDYTMGILNGQSLLRTAQARRTATKIRLGSGQDLGMFNRVIRRNDRDYFKTRLAAVEGQSGAIDDLIKKGILKKEDKINYLNLTPQQKLTQRRIIMAESFMKAKIDDVANADILEKVPSHIKDFVKFGNLDALLRGAGEGASNAISGLNASSRAIATADRYGKTIALNVNDTAMRPVRGSSIGQKSLIDDQGKLAWGWNILIRGTDDIGQRGIQIFDDKITQQEFVDQLAPYIDSLGAGVKSDLIRYSDDTYTSQQHAAAIYDDLKNLFSRQDGESVNMDLLGKIRKVDENGKAFIDLEDFNLEDLPTNIEDLPASVAGPTFIPVMESKNIFTDLSKRGWTWMGEANARFSREPQVVNAAVRYYDELNAPGGYAEDLINQYTKGIVGSTARETATDAAKAQVVRISEELALESTLAFVDNPALRTQLAWSARNFARFYRATEDFYRRLYRTAKYNPEAIQKAALTYEGITHSGFVQKDDQGEAYFIYPGLAPVYGAMKKALDVFGLGDNFVAPIPLEFSGKLKMLTPSFDPESWAPTFSGPLAAVPMKLVYSVVPSLAKSENAIMARAGKELGSVQRATLGPIGEDQGLLASMVPAHVNRLLASLNKDERESQYASAFRKAVTYLEAAGATPGADASPGEIKDYQEALESTVQNILSVRFVAGFFAPASPSVSLKSDMAEWARDNGSVNFKQTWNKLISKYAEQGSEDPYGEAMADWVKFFPKQIPFTVNESDPQVLPYFQSSNAASKWVEDNRALVKKYPQGSAFLIPNTGEFTYDAYQTLMNNGYRQKKLIGDYLKEVSVAKDEQVYYSQKAIRDEALTGAFTDRERTIINDNWQVWSKEFLAARPLLRMEFASAAENTIKRDAAFADLREMIAEPNLTGPTISRLRDMVREYDDYEILVTTQYNSNSDRDIRVRKSYKESLRLRLQEIAAGDPNAISTYSVLFSRLIGE
jgi:hypothetical protein